MTTPIERHDPDTMTVGLDNKRYVGTCSCGWRSKPYDSKRDAIADADEHARQMADPRIR